MAAVVRHTAFLFQLYEMRQHRTRRGRMQPLVDIGIHARNHFGDRRKPIADAGQNLRLALQPMIEISREKRLGIGDRRAMRRI